jgi:hypothetical protein
MAMAADNKGAKKDRAAARATATQEVVVELRTLRSQLELMTEGYRLRVSGQLAELLRLIEGDADLEQHARPLTVKAAQAVLARIEELDFKPKRGRAKDFARLEELVTELTELIPPER